VLVDDAIHHAAPDDAAAIAAQQAARDAFATCADDRRAKGATEPAVRKACGGGGVEQGDARLLKQLVASRAARRAEALAAVRKRFGI
jgi:hypothetical protein